MSHRHVLGRLLMPTPLKNLAGLFDYQSQQAQGPITSLGTEQQALLEQIRKFDPNAQWKYNDFSGSSNEGGQVAQNTYSLDFDQGKLPNAGGTRTNEAMPAFNSAGQAQGIQSLNPGQFNGRLFNDNVAWDSDYGRVTDSRNVNDTSPTDALYRLAPMLIMAIATAGAGAGLMGGLGGAATASGGTALEAALAQMMPGLLQSGASGGLNGQSLLSRFLPVIGQQLGIPSWGTSLGQLALGQVGGRNGGT
jgi:hypothetical protein